MFFIMVFEIESKDHFAGVMLIVTTLIDSQLFQRKCLTHFTFYVGRLLIRFAPDFDSTKGLVTTVTMVFKNFQNTTAGHGRGNHVVTSKSPETMYAQNSAFE